MMKSHMLPVMSVLSMSLAVAGCGGDDNMRMEMGTPADSATTPPPTIHRRT